MKLPADVAQLAPWQLFIHYVNARQQAENARGDGFPWPWSPDPILQAFRFCCNDREHDTVTRWVAANVRPHCADLRSAVRQLVIARLFNTPESLQHLLPMPVTDDIRWSALRSQARALADQGVRLFRGAYMMPAPGLPNKGRAGWDYWLSVAKATDDAMAAALPWRPTHLADVAVVLLGVKGLGRFLVNQVCTDLRYCTWPGISWVDWGTFYWAGPGTARGLARLVGTPLKEAERSIKLVDAAILALREERRADPAINPQVRQTWEDPNNLGNQLCEFDKYARAVEQLRSGHDPRGLRRYPQRTAA